MLANISIRTQCPTSDTNRRRTNTEVGQDTIAEHVERGKRLVTTHILAAPKLRRQ